MEHGELGGWGAGRPDGGWVGVRCLGRALGTSNSGPSNPGLEPSGSNPRDRTLGIELARAGGVKVRGGRSRLLSRVLSCTVHRLMTYDLSRGKVRVVWWEAHRVREEHRIWACSTAQERSSRSQYAIRKVEPLCGSSYGDF